MQLNLSGHHLDITSALRQHTSDKLSKIKHHFDNVMNVNMILEVQKDVQTAEATIHVRGADLFAKAQSLIKMAAFSSLCFDVLEIVCPVEHVCISKGMLIRGAIFKQHV